MILATNAHVMHRFNWTVQLMRMVCTATNGTCTQVNDVRCALFLARAVVVGKFCVPVMSTIDDSIRAVRAEVLCAALPRFEKNVRCEPRFVRDFLYHRSLSNDENCPTAMPL